MRITKFKKFITWNIISLIGYLSLTIMGYFLLMLSLASSQLNMRMDLNEFFYDYMYRYLINPYIAFYKTQICVIFFLMLGSIAENRYYNEHGIYGFRIFDDHEKGYSRLFVIGLALNFCPLYIFTMMVLSTIMKMF